MSSIFFVRIQIWAQFETQLCRFKTTSLGKILETHLSYDVAVFQWVTSCHKTHMTTRVITLRRVTVTSRTTSVSTMRFRAEIMLILRAIKSHLKGYMINRILPEWSFQMNFMSLTEGLFHKFHMK